MKKPKNCWEEKQCGREPGGKKADEMGVCPAARETSLDGIHRGDNAGRCCWIIAGTYCGGKPQGDHAAKLKSCSECEFFKKVIEEEDTNIEDATELLKAMEIVSRN